MIICVGPEDYVFHCFGECVMKIKPKRERVIRGLE